MPWEMGKVISIKQPIVVDGVSFLDGREAILAMLSKLDEACETLTANGYRNVRIRVSIEGVERAPRARRRRG